MPNPGRRLELGPQKETTQTFLLCSMRQSKVTPELWYRNGPLARQRRRQSSFGTGASRLFGFPPRLQLAHRWREARTDSQEWAQASDGCCAIYKSLVPTHARRSAAE